MTARAAQICAREAQLKFLLKTTKMQTTGGVKLIYDDFESSQIGFFFEFPSDVHPPFGW